MRPTTNKKRSKTAVLYTLIKSISLWVVIISSMRDSMSVSGVIGGFIIEQAHIPDSCPYTCTYLSQFSSFNLSPSIDDLS